MSAIRWPIACGVLIAVGLSAIGARPSRAAAAPTQQPQHARQRAGTQRRRGERNVGPAQAPPIGAMRLVPELNGQLVYDPRLNVTWLADANLAASQTFGVSGINPSGSMSFPTAQRWVGAMNAYGRGAGYLGRHDWQLPTFPHLDSTCTSKNKNSFGWDCRGSTLGGLYYLGLGLSNPSTAVRMPPSKTGPFSNFQPYLYWTATRNIHHPQYKGVETFSFGNGILGANVQGNVMYVLPLIRGKLPGTPRAQGRGLQVNPGGQTIYDPVADVTWYADANLAASDALGVPGINPDGAMDYQTAVAFIQAMNASPRYRQPKPWELPYVKSPDSTCSAQADFGFGCTGNPLGELYYKQLKLRPGQPVVPTPNVAVGPFHHLQPYLYWGCEAASPQLPCGTTPPSPNFEWSFSFGNGFQGTDVDLNELYVMVYHPGPAVAPLPPGRGPVPCQGRKCK